MSNNPDEPEICRGCEIKSCKGEPWSCAQDQEDSRADYECERRRDER